VQQKRRIREPGLCFDSDRHEVVMRCKEKVATTKSQLG
jgi:hypothetical protein